ncbi:alpha/beta hydrolase [Sphingomonas immobilis]|uniref:Alpha/beta hydrolase n=1 Tax=Sphingomonas immobilis TaxID=3063997 RepID=A0ABT8ZW24_9SPHN|nr:alpha/beta hydrolase [Sphingomonas sp. CA1-15]MDO7841764.1 alpha/beta hydrolase [Sphingomonas sp. CA1-15]
MTYIPVSIDVTEALPVDVTEGEKIAIAAWIFPATGTPPPVPSVVALLNGGSYDKRYFHVEVPGRTGYSVAEELASRGHLVILLDHLGVGESSRIPTQMKATRQICALANHAAVLEIHQRLANGTLDPAIPAMPQFLKVGGGHSMGGFQTITQQAEHATYDRVLILGYTAIGVHLTVGGQQVPAERPIDPAMGDYWLLDHAGIAESFHWDDVPRDVLKVDEELAVEVPTLLSNQSTQIGIVSDDAGRITVPVYICLGERDVSPRPHDEPSYYKRSGDVTLHILPKSGHCQSFASTRMQMIDRIDGWIRSLPK